MNATPGWRARLLTLAIAAVGVAAFIALALPLPWLLGALCACLVAALLRLPLAGFGVWAVLMRTVLGVAVGASVTPALFARLPELSLSLASVVVLVLLIGLSGYPYFRRLCGLDGPTAYYAAMPGGLQDMLLFGEEAGADVRRLSLIHATRVLVIVVAMVTLLQHEFGIDVAARAAPGLPAAQLHWRELLIMAVCGVAGWRLALRLRIFGASIVGPMLLAAAASLSGLIEHRPPMEAIALAQLFIGVGIGARYAGVTLREVRETVLASAGYCLLLAAWSILFFALGTHLGWLAPLAAALVYAPGGQAEMAVLAMVAGSDVALVVAHHLVRIVTVILAAPVLARWLQARNSG